VLGLFPKVAEDVLVPGQWIELANQRWREAQSGRVLDPHGGVNTPRKDYMLRHQLRLGVDVAGMGRDNTVFAFRYAHYVDKFDKLHGRGKAVHMEVAGKTLEYMRRGTDNFRGLHPQAFIDTIGEGAGVYSRLIEQSDENPILAYRVHSVKFSESGKYNEKVLKDATGEYEFFNMRAYLYWCVRDWLNPDNLVKAMLPPNDELYKQLTQTQWHFRSDGKIQLEEKKDIIERIKMSPDEADALANTFYPVLDVEARPQLANSFKNIPFH
jgi:hypothetical protein